MQVTCPHPNCPEQLQRFREWCAKHWFELPENIRNEYPSARRAGTEALKKLTAKGVDHFNETSHNAVTPAVRP